ncbi:hypothetical protein [uncultured Paraglaciecola sp.]|uniref:hypothetical protein n=1 Tax=uncultured Paraglaciecola sp. TaxID=1765024 RepID=UPI00261F8FA6|nr:hypothetical protein [uncultured Paraglaciecola sp.]
MKSKLLVVTSSLILFCSCEMMQSMPPPKVSDVEVKHIQPVCVWKNSSQQDACEMEYWLRFWYEIEDLSWPERKQKIAALSEQDADILKKVLLSQGKSTPYQDRLRAQRWLESILPKLSQHMRRFILVALYQPSQDLLEMESALVTLSNINTHQSANIKEQKMLLKKQQSQIDQLLNIEAFIMKSNKKDKE